LADAAPLTGMFDGDKDFFAGEGAGDHQFFALVGADSYPFVIELSDSDLSRWLGLAAGSIIFDGAFGHGSFPVEVISFVRCSRTLLCHSFAVNAAAEGGLAALA
jgi:hypothetical protein